MERTGSGRDHVSEGFLKKFMARRSTRRGFVKAALAVTAAAVFVENAGGSQLITEAFLDAIINDRVSIPSALQQTVAVPATTEVIGIGLGDSNMAGEAAGNVPLINRVAQQVKNRGIGMDPVSGAVVDTRAKDIPQQVTAVKRQLPARRKGINQETHLHVGTGANDIKDNKKLLDALLGLGQNPLNISCWRTFLNEKGNMRGMLTKALVKNVGEAAQTLGVSHLTLYTMPPVQFAPTIVDVINQRNKQQQRVVIDVKGTSLRDKFAMAVIASLVQEGTSAVIDAAFALQRKGINVSVVDMAANIPPNSYQRGDQHFDPQAAEAVAKASAQQYREIK